MPWWQRQNERNTRNRIIALLRRGQHTVEELAASLSLTNNAVRAQLAVLEREKVVHAAGTRRDGAVGKPATLYEIQAEGSALFSSAYAPVLAAVLSELGDASSPRELDALLRRVGSRIARAQPPRSTFDERVRAGAAALAGMGADAELVRTADGYELRGHGCVLADAVIKCPASCAVVEQMLHEVTGAEVTERCDRTAQPNCRFAITAPK